MNVRYIVRYSLVTEETFIFEKIFIVEENAYDFASGIKGAMIYKINFDSCEMGLHDVRV